MGALKVWDGTKWNYASSGVGPSYAKIVANSVAQTIPNSAFTVVSLPNTGYNSGLTVSANQLIVTQPGVYVIQGFLNWGGSGTGRRLWQIEDSTSGGTPGTLPILARVESPTGSGVFPSGSAISDVLLSAGTSLRLVAYQSSGAAFDIRHDLLPGFLSVRKGA